MILSCSFREVCYSDRIMGKFTDLTGQKFGDLIVIGLAPRRGTEHRKRIAWQCRCSCGKETVLLTGPLVHGNTKSCGHLKLRTGADNPLWRGGKGHNGAGYIKFSSGSNKNRREHSVVMEELLGRKLLPGETVHHKNGIRDDNRLENLELRASRHGPGQRVEDLVVWAKEILQRYDTPKTISPCCV